jgi:ubiquitin-like-conjugating enzyme ATG3
MVSPLLSRTFKLHIFRAYREKADSGKNRDFLPPDKQYLMTRGVPCLRRATALAYTDADEDAERLVTFGELSSTGKEEDEWVETHAGRPVAHESAEAGEIDEIPDVDDHLSHAMANTSISSTKGGEPEEIPDIDEIPDMEEEGLEDEDDAAVAAPKTTSPAPGVIDGRYIHSSLHL